ncbi:MAG: hypothetical protein CM15mP97_1330 [Actinomycetota bacterium]|nr:MAG: hypothetical protein CM15mP97_1330 [Actinomycetota bacterium]
MRKIYISLFLVFIFCAQNEVVEETINPESTIIEPKATNEESSTTSTTLEIVQLESFENVEFIVLKEKSVVGYLAPKQFLNSGLDIVEGTTREIIGGFTLTLSECDQADSCLYLKDLQIKADISTLKSNNIIRDQAINNQWLQSALFPEAIFRIDELVLPNKNFDSKVEDTIVGKLSIREIELDTPFSITAYLEDDKIFISGFTEIDTTWFGFDAPTRFNAWEVLNPIGIKVELVAKRS